MLQQRLLLLEGPRGEPLLHMDCNFVDINATTPFQKGKANATQEVCVCHLSKAHLQQQKTARGPSQWSQTQEKTGGKVNIFQFRQFVKLREKKENIH